jgi:branched-chain amino acid transport system ATP-binding protein
VTALDDVSLAVKRGGIHGVIGANGAGKTTLLNVVSGLYRVTAGTIAVNGEARKPGRIEDAARRGIARTFQQPRAFMGLSVAENVRLARRARREAAGAQEWQQQVIELFRLAAMYDRIVRDLAFGELRRVSIALAVMHKPVILLMDEPTVGLTDTEIESLGGLIQTLPKQGVDVLLVEHNMPFLMGAVDTVTVLDRGKVIFDGSPAECQRNPAVLRSYLGIDEHAIQG